MKGAKPGLKNVIPMKGDSIRHVPDAPEFMSDDGRAVWERLAPIAVQKERLEPHFEDMFAAYCEAVADFIRFTGEMAAFGTYYATEGRHGRQEKKRAIWGQRQDALSSMQRLSALFGMSPVDESRIGSAGQGDLLAMLEKQLNGNGAN